MVTLRKGRKAWKLHFSVFHGSLLMVNSAVCDTARAGTAIAAINWLAWVGSVGVGAMGVLRGKEEVAPMLKEPKPDMQGV